MTAPDPAAVDPLTPEPSAALADLAELARYRGGIDADDPDFDADPWG